MLENQPGKNDNSDDLDLVNLLLRLFSFVKKYGRLIAAFTISGMLIGYLLFKTSPKLYQSTLLLHSSSLTNTEQINIIDNWNELLKSGEYNVLSERLHGDPEMLKKVAKISAAEIQKLYIPNNPNGFEVTAIVKDNSVLDSLGKGIVYGLENSDFIKAKLASRRATVQELIEKVKIEISKLDSTKKNIERSIGNNNQRSSSVIVDISAIAIQSISLNEKLLGYQDELKFSAAVQVYHKFEKFDKPVSPKLFKLLALGFIGGFAIGYVVALCKYLQHQFTVRTQPTHDTKNQYVPGKKLREHQAQ